MPATDIDALSPDELDALADALTGDDAALQVQTAWWVIGLFGRNPPPESLAPRLAPALAVLESTIAGDDPEAHRWASFAIVAVLESALAGEDPDARQWAAYAVVNWETRFPAP